MKPDAKKTVALKSKQQAKCYLQSGNYGRAFAHFLVTLKLMPQWKKELKIEFSTTLCAWGEQLESQKRFKDLFNCYEQAVDIFPENEEVLSNLGAHLFRLGHLCEAAHYFRQTLEINSNYLPAYRNLQSVCSALVERWHFRMLNDSHRNEAYKEAILKKVRQGFASVLDIGTGTGILSLYAVTSGSEDVHACDYSETMCTIAQNVIHANNMRDCIKVIKKLSSNLTIPDDLPYRKSLVVTETMDCGLLGEHLLQTLVHAWDQLLMPPCPQLLNDLDSETNLVLSKHGIVIPFGARLWVAPIQCHSITNSSFLLSFGDSAWDFKKIWLYSECDEPYDTENLRLAKDCKFLATPVSVFTFDFNDPSQLKAYYRGDYDGKCISFNCEGVADALAVWFDILLDEDITISSSPFSENEECCWDQAIFRFKKPLDSIMAKVNCAGGKLDFKFISKSSESSSAQIKSEYAVSTEMIRFINNKDLQDSLYTLPESFNRVKNVLDLTPFPAVGLRFVQLNDANLFCLLKTETEIAAVEEFLKDNNVDPLKVNCLLKDGLDEILSAKSEQFDFIINNLFELTGELKENSICIIPRLMEVLAPGGVLAPINVTLICQLMNCEWITRTSKVVNQELVETYRIAEFINIYEVSQQLDVDMNNIIFSSLSDPTPCLQLTNADLAANSCLTEEVTITVHHDGCINAVPLWYQYQLCATDKHLSTFNNNSHIKQIVFFVDPPLYVKINQLIVVNVSYSSGIIRLKIKQ